MSIPRVDQDLKGSCPFWKRCKWVVISFGGVNITKTRVAYGIAKSMV